VSSQVDSVSKELGLGEEEEKPEREKKSAKEQRADQERMDAEKERLAREREERHTKSKAQADYLREKYNLPKKDAKK